MKVYPNYNLDTIQGNRHPVFQHVEKRFNKWFDHHTQPGAPLGNDIKFCYCGDFEEGPIYSKSGAICDAIEAAHYEAQETGKPVSLDSFDLEACFQI